MKYTPDKKSIRKYEVPEWFHDAKFGIFIHWGLYSVPAFGIKEMDIVESMKKRGFEEHFKYNPYAEWYLNSLRIPGSPTQKYHFNTYGKDFSYDDFVAIFNKEIKKWKPKEWAELFKRAGAKYVVLVTKHHDGFLLWPSKYQNPNKENYCASRDIVGELSEAIRNEEIKMGFYYSGVLDWTFNPEPIKDVKSLLLNNVRTPEYIEYATNHWYELIDKYNTIILWNDIGYPPTNLYKLFAYFYNRFAEGVINDRWRQIHTKDDDFPVMKHYDFLTPEYKVFKRIKKKKWETNRGIGNSYGYNKLELEKDYLTSEELVRMLVDIVSKNGNLLLNVGPKADGTIPEPQKKCLLGLGKWLDVNGEAVFSTRPWKYAEGKSLDDIDVRFTQNQEALFLHILKKPKGNEITIKSLTINANATIQMLGYEEKFNWKQEGGNLTISMPENLEDTPVYVFKVTPKP
ncbi:MAG: alpha-L-fucosidase [Candidatus Hodarchaeota archaeon]